MQGVLHIQGDVCGSELYTLFCCQDMTDCVGSLVRQGTCMQDDLQHLQMQLVQRQMAEPGLALSPALLFGDPSAWAADPQMLSLLRDIASGQGTCQH